MPEDAAAHELRPPASYRLAARRTSRGGERLGLTDRSAALTEAACRRREAIG